MDRQLGALPGPAVTEKAAFLDRLRQALDAEQKPARHPPTDLAGDPPELQYADRPTGRAAWERAFRALGGEVHAAPTRADVAHAVADAVGGRAPVMVTGDERIAGVAAQLRWPECGIRGAADAAVGVVGAVAGIAVTGSLVIDAARSAGRSASLLPPVCVFVLDANTIVDRPGDVLRDRGRWWPGAVPTQIVIVTGPSRSADIEMTLTVGVHGPGEVHAVIVG
jgi:hypothetical protein